MFVTTDPSKAVVIVQLTDTVPTVTVTVTIPSDSALLVARSCSVSPGSMVPDAAVHAPPLIRYSPPVMLMAVVNWRAATARERTDPGAWTFVCRSAYVDVVVLVRVITGGLETAVEFAGRVRDKTHAEGLDGYIALLGADGRR